MPPSATGLHEDAPSVERGRPAPESRVTPFLEGGPPQRGGERGRVEDVRKVAVVRANALGDFVFALPALEALRAAYPQAEIVLLGRAWHLAFLERRGGPVDRVVAVPPAPGITVPPGEPGDPRALEEFLDTMREERFDLALQLHGGGRHSNPFTARLGARVSAGMRAPDAEELDRWVPYVYFQPEILRYLEVVSVVGAPPVTLEPALDVTARDVDESERALPADGRPLVVLHPGATDGRRRWPPDRFARVGEALASEGARVAVTGTHQERDVVQAVLGGMRVPAEDLCGRLSLFGLTGVLSRSSVVVSNDTGPLHLAAAVGAATVGIYWCGNFINGHPMTRSRHRAVLSWCLRCPVCGLDCLADRCGHDSSFVADAAVADAVTASVALLQAPTPRSRRGLRPRGEAGMVREPAGSTSGESVRRGRWPNE